jgi:3-deoxy-D-manno-octulosonic acid (KDO) 8-phosphate synthase
MAQKAEDDAEKRKAEEAGKREEQQRINKQVAATKLLAVFADAHLSPEEKARAEAALKNG